MTSISNAYQNALLADATYALNVDGLRDFIGLPLESALSTRMTPTLAKYIGDNFTVVTHIETGDVFGSGFDATVWKNNVTGKLTVSMQGTSGLQDFLTDVNLAVFASAQSQLVDMINWWLRISTPTDQSVIQIKTKLAGGLTGQFFELAAPAQGTGLIPAADLVGGIEVNGHSLGGYLATAFTRLFGSQAHVQHTSTFNSAGFAPGSEAVFTELQDLIGPSFGLGRFPAASEQTNYFAENGLNVTTNSFWFSQQGVRVKLFNEEGITLPNHYMYKLTDALALGSALSKLDSTLTTDKMNAMLAAASENAQASIESVFDAVLRVFQGSVIARTTVGDASGSAETRVAFHAKLANLQDDSVFQNLLGKVNFSPVGSNLATQAKARVGFEEIVALETLAPFVLGAASTDGKAALEAIWTSQAWASKYQDWQADKALLALGGSVGNYTDSWINDRTSLLQAVSVRNQRDISNGLVYDASAPGDRALVFQWYGADPLPGEVQSGQSTLIYQRQGGATSKEQSIIFGDEFGNVLSGTDNQLGDHLYGGAGADTLNGLGGNDYLEGGSGADTYQFTGAFGHDTLLDAGGQGTIRINTDVLDGGIKLTDTIWESADRKYIYVVVGADLIIGQRTTPGAATVTDTLTVKNWHATELGINPQEAAAPAPAPSSHLTVYQDYSPAANDQGSTTAINDGQGNTGANGGDYNIQRTSTTGQASVVYSGAASQFITADSWDQQISTDTGNDLVVAGQWELAAGSIDADIVNTGAGSDMVIAGAGGDGAGWLIGEKTVESMKSIAKEDPPTLGMGGFCHETARRTLCRVRNRLGARRRTHQACCSRAEQTQVRGGT